MVQNWNKFCFTTGYVEVSVTLPGLNQNAEGYVSCLFFSFTLISWILTSVFLYLVAWRMGDLARPGYLASTEGM
jgi:beta-glucan synthesis-associated protein KRE6